MTCTCRTPRPFDFEALDRAMALRPRDNPGGTFGAVVDQDRAGVLRVNRTQVLMYRKTGLSEAQADRFAIGIGRHPGEIWPEWWVYASRDETVDGASELGAP